MGRLTTNKDVQEMSMTELAHNGCYIDEKGCARYRDYNEDIDAREFARKLMIEYKYWKSFEDYGLEADGAIVDDDIFDDEMMENLMYDPTDSVGLIALFYRNLWAMAELRQALMRYEDTNLTPEQLIEIDNLYKEKCKEVATFKPVEGYAYNGKQVYVRED